MQASGNDSIVRDNIIKAIKSGGLKQCVVAERSGFSAQQFSDMLNGRKVIRAEYLPDIAKALDVEVADLFSSGHDIQKTSQGRGPDWSNPAII